HGIGEVRNPNADLVDDLVGALPVLEEERQLEQRREAAAARLAADVLSLPLLDPRAEGRERDVVLADEGPDALDVERRVDADDLDRLLEVVVPAVDHLLGVREVGLLRPELLFRIPD